MVLNDIKMKAVYARVCGHGKNKQKVITIPHDSCIEVGDYVRIEKVE